MNVSPSAALLPSEAATSAATDSAAAPPTPFATILRAVADQIAETVGGLESAAGSVLQAAVSAAKQPSQGDEPEDPQARAERLLQEFDALLKRVLEQAGLDTLEELRLQSDGHGSVAVVGDHPRQAAAQRLINGHAELTARFNDLVEQYSLLGAGGDADSGNPLRPDAAGATTRLQLRISLFKPEVAFV